MKVPAIFGAITIFLGVCLDVFGACPRALVRGKIASDMTH